MKEIKEKIKYTPKWKLKLMYFVFHWKQLKWFEGNLYQKVPPFHVTWRNVRYFETTLWRKIF